MKTLRNLIIGYIETNKIECNIEYEKSIKAIYELLAEIKEEYEEIKESE